METLQQRFICLLPKRLGDLIFCTPAIALLHELMPGVTIDVFCGSALAKQVLARNSAINNIYIAAKPSAVKRWTQRYDKIFCLNDEKFTRKVAHYIGAPCYIAHATSTRKHHSQLPTNAVAQALLDHTNVVDKRYCLYPNDDDHQHVANLLRQHHIDVNRKPTLIGFQIGCSRTLKYSSRWWVSRSKLFPRKFWDIQRFYALAQAIHDIDDSIRIILTGTESERKVLQSMLALPNVVDLLGKTTVLETTALMSYLSLFITIDTGPLHIAAATDVPLVALLGATSPGETGHFPMRDNITVFDTDSMGDISVEDVLQAAMSLLQLPLSQSV